MPLGSVCCATGEGWYCDVSTLPYLTHPYVSSICPVNLSIVLLCVKGRRETNEIRCIIQAGYYCTPTGCCRNGRTCSSSGGGGGGGGGSGNPPPITTTSQTQAPPATSSSSSSSSSSVAAPPPPVQTENSVSDGGRPGATMPVRPTLSVDDGLDDVTTPSSTPMSSTTSTSSASARAAQSTGLPAGDGAQPGGAGLVSVSVGLVMAGVLGVVGFMLPIF